MIKKIIAWFFISVFMLFVLGAVMLELDPDPVEPEPVKVKTEAVQVVAEKPAELTDKEKVLDQLSAWDGSNIQLVSQVKQSMNDPKSFEHVKTRAFFMDAELTEQYGGNCYGLQMDFRGSNVYGAKVLNTIYAVADIDSGEILFLEIE